MVRSQKKIFYCRREKLLDHWTKYMLILSLESQVMIIVWNLYCKVCSRPPTVIYYVVFSRKMKTLKWTLEIKTNVWRGNFYNLKWLFLEISHRGIICQKNKDCIVKQMCSNKKINKKFNKKLSSDHSFNSCFLSFFRRCLVMVYHALRGIKPQNAQTEEMLLSKTAKV